MPAKISDRYVSKTDTIALLLLGGIKPSALKEWYGIVDSEIERAQKKIEALKLQEVSSN